MESLIITTPTALRQIVREEFEKLQDHFPKNGSDSKGEDEWMDIDRVRDYLPGNPSKGSVYMSVSRGDMPSHKNGKHLVFLKSEIDAWLMGKRRKTSNEIAAEAERYTSKKVKGGVR